MKMANDDLEINRKTNRSNEIFRSELANEFISRKSGFFAKWSLLIFLFLFFMLFAVTWFIDYPDIVTTRATIISKNNPKEIISLQNGRIIKLFCKNSDTVFIQQIIGYFEASADHEQVIRLDNKLDSTLIALRQNTFQPYKIEYNGIFDNLGELQFNYQEFSTAFLQYKDYIGSGYFIKKMHVLQGDIEYLKQNQTILLDQKGLLEKDLKLTEESYLNTEKLYSEKIISKQDERNEQSKLLGKQLTIPQINAIYLANQIQQREKQKEIDELEHIISQQKIQFQVLTQTFQAEVKQWIRKYIIKAPISGKVNYLIPLQVGSYISENKIIGYVSPLGQNNYYAETILPQSNFGKVHVDQVVQLRLDAYPFSEFGLVIGNLEYISEIATDSGFIAHINLPKGLITTQNMAVTYHNGLKAEARVVTKDVSLFERFFDNFKANINK